MLNWFVLFGWHTIYKLKPPAWNMISQCSLNFGQISVLDYETSKYQGAAILLMFNDAWCISGDTAKYIEISLKRTPGIEMKKNACFCIVKFNSLWNYRTSRFILSLIYTWKKDNVEQECLIFPYWFNSFKYSLDAWEENYGEKNKNSFKSCHRDKDYKSQQREFWFDKYCMLYVDINSEIFIS